MYSGQTFVITGASKGIGLQYVTQVLEADGNVVAAVRSPDECLALQELQEKHGKALTVVGMDVGVYTSVRDAAAVVERVRPEGIDFLVVNAGTATPVHDVNTADIDLDPEEFDEVFRVNVSGAFATIKAFYPLLKRKEGGRKTVVSMTSLGGTISATAARARDLEGALKPADNVLCAYKASKAALNQPPLVERVLIRRAPTTKQKADAVFVLHEAVTVQLAQSLKSEGFTFIALHPGMVDTDIASDFIERFRRIIGEELLDSPGGMLLTPAYSVQKQLEFLVSSTAARDNGRYVGIEGKDTPW